MKPSPKICPTCKREKCEQYRLFQHCTIAPGEMPVPNHLNVMCHSCPPAEKEEDEMKVAEEAGCPCDFHTKDLTEEQARIALFKPIVGGEEAPPLVLIERFHHLWDAKIATLHEAKAQGRREERERCIKVIEDADCGKECTQGGWCGCIKHLVAAITDTIKD